MWLALLTLLQYGTHEQHALPRGKMANTPGRESPPTKFTIHWQIHSSKPGWALGAPGLIPPTHLQVVPLQESPAFSPPRPVKLSTNSESHICPANLPTLSNQPRCTSRRYTLSLTTVTIDTVANLLWMRPCHGYYYNDCP